MEKIDAKNHLEIALLGSRVAKAALDLQDMEYNDLLRLGFAGLIECISDLEKVMPWKKKLANQRMDVNDDAE